MTKARRIPGGTVKLLLCVVFASSASLSQIPNAGFESWETDPDSNQNPVGWQTTNSYPLVTVERSSPGWQGSYAMKVKTVNAGFPFPGVAMLETGFPFTAQPARFSAYVKSTIMPGDEAFLIIGLMKGDSIIAATGDCTFRIDTSYSQFTYLEFPISYQSSEVPDSLVIIVASGLGSGQVGTELIVDDLAIGAGGSTDVLDGNVPPPAFVLSQNYPNPFNPFTTIRYQLPLPGYVRLKVFDILGREVATLVDGMKTPGEHSITWDASSAASGSYVYRLQSGAFVESKRLVVLK
ncbi:MAG: T9SS type A sorting domain-containing protein [Bacteroidota bacterium]